MVLDGFDDTGRVQQDNPYISKSSITVIELMDLVTSSVCSLDGFIGRRLGSRFSFKNTLQRSCTEGRMASQSCGGHTTSYPTLRCFSRKSQTIPKILKSKRNNEVLKLLAMALNRIAKVKPCEPLGSEIDSARAIRL